MNYSNMPLCSFAPRLKEQFLHMLWRGQHMTGAEMQLALKYWDEAPSHPSPRTTPSLLPGSCSPQPEHKVLLVQLLWCLTCCRTSLGLFSLFPMGFMFVQGGTPCLLVQTPQKAQMCTLWNIMLAVQNNRILDLCAECAFRYRAPSSNKRHYTSITSFPP